MYMKTRLTFKVAIKITNPMNSKLRFFFYIRFYAEAHANYL